jgi:ribA/ribD-fused uncharacterized protein
MADRIDSFKDEYLWLSNFFRCSVVYKDEEYASVEHAYQAAKTFDMSWHGAIKRAATPAEAKRIGKQVPRRPDWDLVKLDLMLMLLRQKFSSPKLSEMLLNTGDAELVEGNSWHDEFWGVCNGKGQNNLGRLLMQVRDELRRGLMCEDGL